jgi:MraZ protein
VLIGSHHYTLDEKGRLVLPPPFREAIKADGGDRCMLTRMFNTIYGYSLNEWEQVKARILERANKNDEMRRVRRSFFGNAHDCQLDKQGRILIPPMLREAAKLEKEIVLVGDQDHFEIWRKDNWELEDQTVQNNMQNVEVRNEIAQLGI